MVRAYAERMQKSRSGKQKRVTRKHEVQAEQEILQITLNVVQGISNHLVFGYHTREDMIQQAVVEALSVLETEKYDPERPLENFLQVHIRNRLLNIRRREAFRSEPPCSCCDRWEPPEQPCSRWLTWQKNNSSKQALLRAADVFEVNLSTDSLVVQQVEANELRDRIREFLPEEFHEDYDRVVNLEKISHHRLKQLRDACTHALQEMDYASETEI